MMKYETLGFGVVSAIIDGSQTQLRRCIRPKYHKGEVGFQVAGRGEDLRVEILGADGNVTRTFDPPLTPDTIIGVRESFSVIGVRGKWKKYVYRATDEYPFGFKGIKNFRWHPPKRMPDKAVRLFIRINDCKIKRVSDLTDDDFREMGYSIDALGRERSESMFISEWNKGVGGIGFEKIRYHADPWCWVYTIEPLMKAKGE